MGCAEGFFFSADGGLLSVLGDLLFAGAILMLIYPCVQRTWNRLDRNFFQQLCYILEIVVAVTMLSFLLMLLVAQQMRMAYCALIRPLVGESPEDKVYAGVLLKVLVFVLIVFNYYCATGLQTLVNSFWDRVVTPSGGGGGGGGGGRGGGGGGRSHVRSHVEMAGPVGLREALNNNTNSQAAVTQTVTTTLADVLPSLSFSPTRLSCMTTAAVSGSSPAPSLLHQQPSRYPHVAGPSGSRARQQPVLRDVGTMVRFPDSSGPLLTLEFPKKRGDRGPRALVLQQGRVSQRSVATSSSSTTVRDRVRTQVSPVRVSSRSSVRTVSSSSAQASVSSQVVNVQSHATIDLPQRQCTVQVQRKRVKVPRLPKVLRSGKTYGYY